MIHTINYTNGQLSIIDQTKLPTQMELINIDTVQDCWDAIKALKVRGAPAIGIAAAYGAYLGARSITTADPQTFQQEFRAVTAYLATSRPTAVNLFWALERMERTAQSQAGEPVIATINRLEQEAIKIHEEDAQTCRRIGEHGLELLSDGMTILTHCNAGRLATAQYGTALAPIYLAKEQGMQIRVFADETRPLLQGARLTAFELMEAGVDVTLITDNMAGMVMKQGKINAVIVGTDRVAANGDVANKIGTYGVALLAKAHGIPFYVAGPLSTIDLATPTGDDIPIEERDPMEVTHGMWKQTAPTGVKVYNPAFDVTPHELVSAIITEQGIARPPYEESLKRLFEV